MRWSIFDVALTVAVWAVVLKMVHLRRVRAAADPSPRGVRGVLLARALAMAQVRNGKLVPHAAAGDAVLVLAKLLRGQKIPNT